MSSLLHIAKEMHENGKGAPINYVEKQVGGAIRQMSNFRYISLRRKVVNEKGGMEDQKISKFRQRSL